MKFTKKIVSVVLMIFLVISALPLYASAQTTPQTGDNSLTILWVILGVVAVAALAVISKRFVKRGDDEDDEPEAGDEPETEDKTEE